MKGLCLPSLRGSIQREGFGISNHDGPGIFSGVFADYRLFLPMAVLLLSHCANNDAGGLSIAGPAHGVNRSEAIEIAYTYSRVSWTPEQRHVLHGNDGDGILVNTPDVSLTDHGFSNGWWQVGKQARGVPYQWGGFDTPNQFLTSLGEGEVAGDISTAGKRRLGDAGTSKSACGIDCSGFVSRCWRLSRPYSTQELPSICDKLASWSELKPGDILLNDRHVVLFAKWSKPGSSAYVYEAGPFPVWRVNAAEIPKQFLIERGYQPWRYRNIRD